MSLWGNNDNVTSAGKITAIDYDAKTVTGSGTAWGAAGSAQVGDVLRIGVRGPGVAATYFGDADRKKNPSEGSLCNGLSWPRCKLGWGWDGFENSQCSACHTKGPGL